MSDPTPTGSIASLRTRLLQRVMRTGPYAADINEIVRLCKINHPKADLTIIDRAFETAELAHRGQTRRSGEAYITHPIAVTRILAELGIGPVTLAAALLHDTVEDTDYDLASLRRDFGDEVAMLVDGVTKLDKVKFGDDAQAVGLVLVACQLGQELVVRDTRARRQPGFLLDPVANQSDALTTSTTSSTSSSRKWG